MEDKNKLRAYSSQTRRSYLVVAGCLLSVTLLWAVMGNQQYLLPTELQQNLNEPNEPNEQAEEAINEVVAINSCVNDGRYAITSDKIEDDSTNKDYLTEEESLSFDPLTDVMNVASMRQSILKIIDKSKSVRVGDEIKISVILKNLNGNLRTRGGDKLHVRIMNTRLDAYAPGYAIDHDNGTYTVVVPALWPGQSIISVHLAYPRELIRAFYVTKRQCFTARAIMGRYESGKLTEEVLCQPAREYFRPSQDVCNLTVANGGTSWYCEKPKNKFLLCEDWMSVAAPSGTVIFNDAEKEFTASSSLWDARSFRHEVQVDEAKLDSTRREIGEFRNITVFVKGTLQNRAELPDCSSVPKRQTWIPQNTSGFFYKGQWQPTFCNLPGDHKYSQCLRGKHFRFFGDSTIRQWYKYMIEYLNCNQMTEKWSERAWHKRTLCYSSTMNFTAEWIPHGQPFYVGNHWDTRRYTTHPISAYLNEVSDNSKLILVVHIFSHYSNFRSEIFLDRMKVISKSAKHLLERAKNVMVLVKGPHTINQVRGYWYYHYRAIMKKEFEALQDRVVFMEQGDMTIAKRNEPIHPEIDILKEAVRQLIGYTC